jgi:hypothetical protein
MSKYFSLNLRVPEWANWMAQNREGDWWVFANKPEPDKTHDNWRHPIGEINEPCMRVAVGVGPADNWKGSLERIA